MEQTTILAQLYDLAKEYGVTVLHEQDLKFARYQKEKGQTIQTGEFNFLIEPVIRLFNFNLERNLIFEIITLAHELGHVKDFKDNLFTEERWKREYPQKAVYFEFRAWRNAITFLKSFGFEKWDIFLEDLERCLLSYCRRFYGNKGLEVTQKMKYELQQIIVEEEDLNVSLRNACEIHA